MTAVSARCSLVAVAVILLTYGIGEAQCPPSCAITGGGDPATDCNSEFAATGMRLNAPHFDPAKPTKPQKEVRCFDGEPGCDLDGTVNDECVFDVDLCFGNADPELPACTPSDTLQVRIARTSKSAGLAALQSAVDALLPATPGTCTSGNTMTVGLKGPNGKGDFKAGKGKVKVVATTATSADKDRLKLRCLPHRWPHHGYDANNRRSTPLATGITPANASQLQMKWQFDIDEGMAKGVTSTPTLDRKQVYVSSWNGKVYALKKKTGKVKWSYDTQSGGQLGVQASVTVTADGRVVVGDSRGEVHCLDAKKGKLLWKADVGDSDLESAHIWGAPTVANGRVFVGRASHSDNPCTRGHLYAFDLDTGAELWRFATVPEKVCDNDTSLECTTNADCGGGTCVDGIGGGVSAAPAVSEDGETVFMVSVGCYTSPSIGNSDALFSLDAATGALNWVHRTESIEQYADGPPYHDFGFLNGPILVDADDGLGGTQELVVAGSKDGTIYAVDRATGAVVWTNELVPAPEFAGFGLFNGAVAYADGRFYAALYETPNWPDTNDHLYAFSEVDGAVDWQDQIGASWADATVAGGVLYVGGAAFPTVDPEFYLYDAATGARLATLVMPDAVAGGVAVENGVVYVPYGIVGSIGGVMAYEVPD
jgi:polyvinyl alcohol dehydrogenase (cytochrome)